MLVRFDIEGRRGILKVISSVEVRLKFRIQLMSDLQKQLVALESEIGNWILLLVVKAVKSWSQWSIGKPGYCFQNARNQRKQLML